MILALRLYYAFTEGGGEAFREPPDVQNGLLFEVARENIIFPKTALRFQT